MNVDFIQTKIYYPAESVTPELLQGLSCGSHAALLLLGRTVTVVSAFGRTFYTFVTDLGLYVDL